MRKQKRLTELVSKMGVLLLLFVALFSSFHLLYIENYRPMLYVIALQTDSQRNWMNAVKMVNRLLHLNMTVYWLAEPLTILVDGNERAFSNGDFIIPLYQDFLADSPESSAFFPRYVENLATEFNVSVTNIRRNIECHAYPLHQTKIAVYYGGGVTGGSLEHIHLLEEAGFSLGTLREEDLRLGKLAEYNIITFPGGGPYGNYLSEEETESVKDFVQLGGGFLGTCGGLALGIELNLLDADVVTAGQYEAYAELRGPIVLNLTNASNPVVFGCPSHLESTYFMGSFISRVGGNVETIGTYYSPGQDLSSYSPEIIDAFNLTLKLVDVNDFWGFPSIISGRYGAGKVVLSTVHPEILPSSQRLFINSIFYLSSGERILFKSSEYPASARPFESSSHNAGSSALDGTLLQVRSLMSTIEERAYGAREELRGLEEANYEIVGVSGEYLTLFLEDIESRSLSLLVQLDGLTDVYEDLEGFIKLLSQKHPLRPILSLIHEDMLLAIESVQRKILGIYHSMPALDDTIRVMDAVDEELSAEKLLLQQLASENVSSADRAQQVINLYASESATLAILKDDLDYYLLQWSVGLESVLTEAHFLSHAAEQYLAFYT